MSDTIEVLVVKAGEHPWVKAIPNTLKALQDEVGGYIEPVYLKGNATLYCNEEGKIGRWQFNRAIVVGDVCEGGDENALVDLISHTFVVTGFNPNTGDNESLSDEQLEYWKKRFYPLEFLMLDGHGTPFVNRLVD